MAQIDVREIQGLFQVGKTIDSKGNPVAALEILGIPVLYAPVEALDRHDADDWEEVFGRRFALAMAKLLVGSGDPATWTTTSPTGRDVLRLSPKEN